MRELTLQNCWEGAMGWEVIKNGSQDKLAMATKFGPHYDNQQRRQWHPTPVRLPGKSHGRRSLVGCSPWGYKESDMTTRLHFHFSLSCIGKGNGNPLQCSCLESPGDGGAWWLPSIGSNRVRFSSSSSMKTNHGRGISGASSTKINEKRNRADHQDYDTSHCMTIKSLTGMA